MMIVLRQLHIINVQYPSFLAGKRRDGTFLKKVWDRKRGEMIYERKKNFGLVVKSLDSNHWVASRLTQ